MTRSRILAARVLHAALFFLVFAPVAAWAEDASFQGRWETTYGVLVLSQNGTAVTGSYTYGGGTGTVAGTVEKRTLTFKYEESSGVKGEGKFELNDSATRFDGTWHEEGEVTWQPWSGVAIRTATDTSSAGFDGLFDTTYGPMRLRQSTDAVTGTYLFQGAESTIKGTVKDATLTFTYKEEKASGEGTFDLSDDGMAFSGAWKPAGTDAWSPWIGTRVVPEVGVSWLVVFETQWERSLSDNEYSYGDMLRSFFERLPKVQVRQRRIADKADFLRAGAELAYLAEPVALWVSGHGTEEGLSISGDSIAAKELLAVLKPAPNVFLVHFSSCAIMGGKVPAALLKDLSDGRSLDVSGYAVPVDWAGSAVLEMLYLDLILGRQLTPKAAAEVVLDEMNFADDTATTGSPLGALKFRIEGIR